MFLDVLLALGAVAAIITALPPLGIDIRVFGRRQAMTNVPAKWRWWFVLVIASSAFVVSIMNIYMASHQWNGDEKSLEPVTFQNFSSQEVVLDGKNFQHCTFNGVTLVFKGKKTFFVADSAFAGTTVIKVPSGPPLEAAMMMSDLLKACVTLGPQHCNPIDSIRLDVTEKGH